MASTTGDQRTAADRDQHALERMLARIRSACADAFLGTPVFLAYVYGSRCWGMPTVDRDLDVGYYVRGSPSVDCLALAEELRVAGSLSDKLGVEVDLRCLSRAPLALRGRVLEEGRRIYCSDDVLRVNLERDLLGEHHDYKIEIESLRRTRFLAMAGRRR